MGQNESRGSSAPSQSTRPRVILGVAGGIAAYKAVEVLRGLTETGHDVTVVPTASALKFVGAATFAALSGHPVRADVWDDVHEVPHVRLGQQADLVLVVPATAETRNHRSLGLVRAAAPALRDTGFLSAGGSASS